jgi:hypothetical protein
LGIGKTVGIDLNYIALMDDSAAVLVRCAVGVVEHTLDAHELV